MFIQTTTLSSQVEATRVSMSDRRPWSNPFRSQRSYLSMSNCSAYSLLSTTTPAGASRVVGFLRQDRVQLSAGRPIPLLSSDITRTPPTHIDMNETNGVLLALVDRLGAAYI